MQHGLFAELNSSQSRQLKSFNLAELGDFRPLCAENYKRGVDADPVLVLTFSLARRFRGANRSFTQGVETIKRS